MTLHNPGSIKLPPLEIDKMDALEKMENNRCISNFIDSKLLLDCEFNKLYSDIQEKSEKIFYYIKLINEDNFEWKNRRNLISKAISTYYFEKDKEHGSFSSIEDLSREDLLYLIKRYGWIEDKDKYDDNRLLEARGGENTALKNEIMSLSHEIQDLLNEFEKKKGKKLNIISHTLINFCDNCNNIISLGRFRPSKCYCGDKIKNASDITPITIFHFNKELTNFINKNCWLEYGVDNLLKKKQFTTLVGFYVLGHSGNWHEIDNIAESRKMNYRFFCECKSGKQLKPKDIFIFSGKMGDIGCTRGYIFTTQNRIKKEIIRLARSKNIDIISNVLNKSTDELLKEIKEK